MDVTDSFFLIKGPLSDKLVQHLVNSQRQTGAVCCVRGLVSYLDIGMVYLAFMYHKGSIIAPFFYSFYNRLLPPEVGV